MSKNKEMLTPEQIEILNNSYPAPEESNRLSLPRFGMLSKDVTESSGTGKNKKITVLEAAGTFFTESDEGEVDEDGKKVWTRKYIDGETVDVQIVYHRRQLRKYDSSLEKYISSPIFDNAEQVIPLYLDKQVIKRGTQAELQKLYPALTQKGKPTSDLREETILYVIYKDILYQANISQSSKWEFKAYCKTVNPSTVITTLGSKEETFGENTYRKMTFKNKRMITSDEFDTVNDNQTLLKETVESDKKFYLSAGTADTKADAELDEMVSEAQKALK
jgi:hypothetical protein